MGSKPAQLDASLVRTAVLCNLVSTLLGSVALAGWLLQLPILTRFQGQFIPMAPSTAMGFALVGVALHIHLRVPRNRVREWVMCTAGVLVGIVSFWILLQLVLGLPGDVEGLVLQTSEMLGNVPVGRMSPLTAGSFILASCSALLLWASEFKRPHLKRHAAIPAALVLLVGSIVVLGYLYGTPLLYGGWIIPVALPTGIAFVMLGSALIAAAGPDSSLVRAVAGDSVRARLMRSFLPMVIVVILVEGWVGTLFLRGSLANPALVASLSALVFAAIASVLVSRLSYAIGGRIDRVEAQLRTYAAERKRAEDNLRVLNEELERRVAERTAEMAAANKELEAFSYSVSHDLRAPLRALDGFSRILLEEHAAQLAPEAQRYLGLVRDNASRMGELVDDLLTFSRLSRQPLKLQAVAPAELARRALEELHAEREGRRVEVVIGDLPSCQADPALLKQVFVNLLSNALKFTRRREVARIEVGSRDEGGEPVCFISDNGAGFDMRYSDKLFGVFQRLHRAEEYEGTGVGLAIVQRVIHRHGGRVWAEAETDKGATFYFTLGGDTTHDVYGSGRNPAGRGQPQ